MCNKYKYSVLFSSKLPGGMVIKDSIWVKYRTEPKLSSGWSGLIYLRFI